MNVRPALLAAALAGSAASLHAAPPACEAHGSATAPTVVELYTSEGCSSCPPADRWLSARRTQPGVIALAFHVDYWDTLGWPDRYASPAHTARQRELQRLLGLRFIYTPQVVLNGEDRKDWHRLATLPAAGAAGAEASLRQLSAGIYEAQIRARPGSPALAAYWAVTEDGHETAVGAGENRGATLRHDAVVRQYHPLPAFVPGAAARFTLEAAPGEKPQRVVLVVYETATGRPVQAVSLGC